MAPSVTTHHYSPSSVLAASGLADKDSLLRAAVGIMARPNSIAVVCVGDVRVCAGRGNCRAMRLHRLPSLWPLFLAAFAGLGCPRAMAFSPAGATRMSPVPVQADSRVCSLCAASRWRRRAGVENVWLHRRQRMLVPRMNEQQEDARDAINDRMASEFERVSFELSQMGVLGDDDYQVATRVSDGPSSFTADELVALQSLLGQDAAPEQQCVEEGEMWPHGKTLSCGGEAYSSTDGHSAVVAGDGRLFTWGSGGSGRLGRQSADAEAVPAAVGGLLDDVRRQAVRVRAVSCGFDHSACVTDDGRVFVWGSGGRGQVASHVACHLRMTACVFVGGRNLQHLCWICLVLVLACAPWTRLCQLRGGGVGNSRVTCDVRSWGLAACSHSSRLPRFVACSQRSR